MSTIICFVLIKTSSSIMEKHVQMRMNTSTELPCVPDDCCHLPTWAFSVISSPSCACSIIIIVSLTRISVLNLNFFLRIYYIIYIFFIYLFTRLFYILICFTRLLFDNCSCPTFCLINTFYHCLLVLGMVW